MPIDVKKVNDVLREIATILQAYRPNVEELELIQSKINSMVNKNRQIALQGHKVREKRTPPIEHEKWYKIDIED